MKISIIGSNGFLSTAIGKYINKKMWELEMYGLDVPHSHTYSKFYQIDLMNEKLDCFQILKSDIIIYAAGAGIQASMKDCVSNIYYLNTFLPVYLCTQLQLNGYQGAFVTFGSVFEMGEVNEKRKFTEIDILTSTAKAPSDYVVSKRMLSKFSTSFSHRFTHWHFIIPTIYGRGENPNRLIPYIINGIRRNEQLMFTSGEQIRQYIHVDNIPILIALAYQYSLPSGMYNIEGNEMLSVREIVEKIYNLFGMPLPNNCFGKADRTDTGMKYLALDGSKLYQAIKFTPEITISDVVFTY